MTDIEFGAAGDAWVSAVVHPQFGGGGVAHFEGETWTSYTVEDGLASNDVTCLAVADDGTLWIGTQEDGAAFLDGQSWTACAEDDVPSVKMVMADFDSRGRLWLGGNGGVTMFDGAGFKSFDYRLGFPGDWAYDMAQDPQGRIWFASWHGVSRFDPDL